MFQRLSALLGTTLKKLEFTHSESAVAVIVISSKKLLVLVEEQLVLLKTALVICVDLLSKLSRTPVRNH